MKIHFVFAPPLVKSKMAPLWEAALPPLGVLYLASYLQKSVSGIDLRVTDGLLRGMDQTIEEVRAFGPDVLCVSFFTGSALGAYHLINKLDAEIPNLYVIAGGPHATALPQDTLLKSSTDVVVRGEGEQVLAELVKFLVKSGKPSPDDLQMIQGVAFLNREHKLIMTPSPFLEPDLDKYPFPSWDLLPINEYRGYHLCKQTPEFPILFSRGCPHDCVFCPNEHWNLSKPKVRFRSPQNIVNEMDELVMNYGIREFNNLADELNNHPKVALEICNEIKRRKLGVSWKTMLRSDNVPEDLVRAMAEAGCWLVSLGIETGNPETMIGIKKHFSHEQIETACKLFKKYNMKVQGYFMLFNAWEEREKLYFEDCSVSMNTVNYAQRLFDAGLLDYMGWSVSTPYPGSELYQIAVRHNLIKPHMVDQWDEWAQNELFVMKFPNCSETDQIRVVRKAQTLGAKASIFRNGLRLKDIPMMTKTAIHTIRTEFSSRFGNSDDCK